MTTVHNTETLRYLQEATQVQQGTDDVPKGLASQIVPVIDINPHSNRIIDVVYHGFSAATGDSTIVTLPSSVDTYLTGAFLSIIKDAACDMTTGVAVLKCTLASGVTKEIIRIATLTLTAQNANVYCNFLYPMKLQAGSVIQITGAFTAGTLVKSGVVYGFQVNNSRG